MASHPPQQYRSARPAGHNGIRDPRFDEQGGTRLNGSIGSGRHHSHHHQRITLVLYPNMGAGTRWFVVSRQGHAMILDPDEKTVVGRLYVVGGKGESYEAVGGPQGEEPRRSLTGRVTAAAFLSVSWGPADRFVRFAFSAHDI